MDPRLVFAFWGVALLLIVVPGPDWAFVLAVGLRERTVTPAVGGLMLGYLLLTGVVAGGVGAVVAGVPAVLTVLTIVGAAYLVYLGTRTLTRPAAIQHDSTERSTSSRWRLVLSGVGVSALNPKGVLVFLAMLPQFTRTAGWPAPLQFGVLGLVFVGTCGVFYSVLGAGAGAILRTRPAVARRVSLLSGAAMIVIGVLLFAERLVRAG
ncbi:LysE family translocator [Nakamurella lactea]|uniref:LysE family translocator n=1 Tax=Nakamurella lactea TaxID=459515 RepID=UPI0003F76E36|nr:LysE family translocator [Nakamurella lactea]